MESDVQRFNKLVAQIDRDAREAFPKASDAEKENALKIATAEVDRVCRFKGHKATSSQSLSWPRTGVTDKDGNAIKGVPEQLKKATYFLAGRATGRIPDRATQFRTFASASS